jgi:hypothetical protein
VAHWSIYSETEVNFPFLNPGVFLVQGSGEWLLLVSGEDTRKPLFNVQMIIQDMATSRAIRAEHDQAKINAMIVAGGGTIQRSYPEIGQTFLGDRIQWLPIDVNDQEYNVQSRYRIGDKAFLSVEEIRIVNVGTRFISPTRSDAMKVNWQVSVTVRNQSGDVLMHCVDPRFPHDSHWAPGTACNPGLHYGPLPRSVYARCFCRGFEFFGVR